MFTILKQIGEGGYGSVSLVNHVRLGKVVLKELRESSVLGVNDRCNLQREADVLKTLRHPNVVTFFEGQFDSKKFSGMFLEFVEYGSVDGFLERFSVDRVWKVQIIFDVVLAMCCLHEQEPAIIHGDLKCQNILIGRDFRAKICDFGLARIQKISKFKIGGLEGTLEYIAPEYFRDPTKAKTDKFDVYSFAISAWEIFLPEESLLRFL